MSASSSKLRNMSQGIRLGAASDSATPKSTLLEAAADAVAVFLAVASGNGLAQTAVSIQKEIP
jgi:hypothetical protein